MQFDTKKLLNKTTSIILTLIIICFFEPTIGSILFTIYCTYKVYEYRSTIIAFIANTKYHGGRIQKALNYYRYAATIKNSNPKYITIYVYLELKCGSYEKAEEILNKILTERTFTGEDLFSVQMNKALIEWKKGELDNCIEILENIYNQDFKNRTLLETLGYMLIIKGDLQKALEFNTEALNFSDENVIISANLGEIYYKLGEKEKAEEILLPLAEQNLTFAEPYYYLALILNEKGEKENAIDLLNTALNLPESILTNLTTDQISETLENIEALNA
ncbi:Tetratricopeptide repeat-containing protein [Clostridium cavendishii DSM 21758]|uniref:Tetratricopeptide repeat-containing protein n=1 Tax=Clostridium cavendishii DSM 21758 TaxID=1121302 RepID=A0A1M6NQP2_9CLOT|nr:tetratricopeptide repeat protein [Clostridium cavendishii]SHJ97936.1 Tetratricopeptide repeat-containing protein [Clostridium cavendishii DSM 21758]